MEQPIDEAAVWARVMAATKPPAPEPAPQPPPQPAPCPPQAPEPERPPAPNASPNPELLLPVLVTLRVQCMLLQALGSSPMLRALTQQTRRLHDRLSGLYTYITGTPAGIPAPGTMSRESARQRRRQQAIALAEGWRTLTELADAYDREIAAVLHTAATDCLALFQRMLPLLG